MTHLYIKLGLQLRTYDRIDYRHVVVSAAKWEGDKCAAAVSETCPRVQTQACE